MAGGRKSRWRGDPRDESRGDVHAVAQRGAATARFRLLAEIARVSWSPGTEPLFRELAEAARAALEAASVSLAVWEPEFGRVRCLVNVGALGPGELPDPVDEVYSLDDYGPLGMLLEAQLGWVVSVDEGGLDDPSVRLLRELGKASGMSVPIPGQGRVWGELYATRATGQSPFSTDDLDFAVAVGAQVGAALVTGEHLRRVEQQLHLDPVTGLAGRREVDDRLDAALASWHSDRLPAALLMVDVAGLRDLATVDGRHASDLVVRRCAGLVSTAASRLPGGVAGRYDWDRFCVVATGVPADDVADVAAAFVHEARRLLPVPVVCGVAATDDPVGPVPNRERLVRLVEAAQSRSRQAGGLVPVVAGRPLPVLSRIAASVGVGEPGALSVLPDPEPVTRGAPSGWDSTGQLLRLSLDVIEQAGPLLGDRLAALATTLCHHLDGLGWWVSTVSDDDMVETVEFARYRMTPSMVSGLSAWSDPGYPLADYPSTASAVDGGWFVVEAADGNADPAELAMLDGMGASALLAAGGVDRDGRRWLVEVFTDSLSRPVDECVPVLRALLPTSLCTHRPPGPATAVPAAG